MKGISMTLLYKDITLSTLFLERVKTDVSVREREIETERRRHTETDRGELEGLRHLDIAILILIFFLAAMCHTQIKGCTSFLF